MGRLKDWTIWVVILIAAWGWWYSGILGALTAGLLYGGLWLLAVRWVRHRKVTRTPPE